MKSTWKVKNTWKVPEKWKAHEKYLKSEKHMKCTPEKWKAPNWKVKSTPHRWKAHEKYLKSEKHMKSHLKGMCTTCIPSDQVKMRDLCWVQLFFVHKTLYKKHCAFHEKWHFSWKALHFLWKALRFSKDHLQGIVTLCFGLWSFWIADWTGPLTFLGPVLGLKPWTVDISTRSYLSRLRPLALLGTLHPDLGCKVANSSKLLSLLSAGAVFLQK